MDRPLILAIDLGTTAVKVCLYEVGQVLGLRAAANRRLTLTTFPDGRAEQDPESWWKALQDAVPEVLGLAGVSSQSVGSVTFCAQMQALVLVDRAGNPVRPAISYLDQKATSRRQALTAGGPRVAGIGLGLLLPWLHVSGGVAASAKDPVWKYLRVAEEEPEIFSKIHRWLDAKDFLTARCTGRFTMSLDSAFATFLCDTRPGRSGWSRWLVRRFGVDPKHLPEIVQPSDVVGPLTPEAAKSLGLEPGIPVFAGAGDASLIGVGAGATAVGSTHIYVGTSGWVSTVADRRIVDTEAMMATVPGVVPGQYSYFGEQETSGKCLEWVRDHLALDEIGVYFDKQERPSGKDEEDFSLIDYLTKTIRDVEAGSGGVLFAPWLHGNRSPFEDPLVRGMFFNVGLDTGKRQLIRAVVEGLAYNKRWLLEAQGRKVKTSKVVRFAGGGALSDETCRILSDVTGCAIEAIADPQNAGAAGAALTAAWGLGWYESLDSAAALIPVRARFTPRIEYRAVHQRNFDVFRQLYPATASLFHRLNG